MKENVYDLDQYRKRKRARTLTKKIYKNKFTIAVFLLISLNIGILVFVSLNAAISLFLFNLVFILIAKQRKVEAPQQTIRFKKPK
jgi:hypothetical protein